jgi:hypothetical protein
VLLVIAQEEVVHYRYFPTLFTLFSTYNRSSVPSRFNFLAVGFGCKNPDIKLLISIELLQFKGMLTLNKIPDRYLENYVPFHKQSDK